MPKDHDRRKTEHLGAYLPDFAPLTRLLGRVVGTGVRVAAPGAQEPTGAAPATAMLSDTATEATPEHVSGAPSHEPSHAPRSAALDRHAALELIREARHWFEQHEPSSPIPVLLRRAELFVGKRYADVVKAISLEMLE